MKIIKTLSHIDAEITIPGSKSITQRALVCAALADGASVIKNPLIADDTKHLSAALEALGARIDMTDGVLAVEGTGGVLINPSRPLTLGNNGTALRFLTALCSLGTGTYVIDGSARLRERPVGQLLEALRTLGVTVQGGTDDLHPPVTVTTKGLSGGAVAFTDAESSQYISAMLLASPYAKRDVTIRLSGHTRSLPYIDITIAVMRAFGIDKIEIADGEYRVTAPQTYKAMTYTVEGDLSSASYFFLAAALLKGRVRVKPVPSRSVQGDARFLHLLEKMGCTVRSDGDAVEVTGGNLADGTLTVDMGDMPDMAPTLAALAAVRSGVTIIAGVPHLRWKETDRIAALATELRKTGIATEERPDGLIINGGNPRGAVIETYDDHRIAMSFAVLGLLIPGMTITNENTVNKSFPGFWTTLEKLYR